MVCFKCHLKPAKKSGQIQSAYADKMTIYSPFPVCGRITRSFAIAHHLAYCSLHDHLPKQLMFNLHTEPTFIICVVIELSLKISTTHTPKYFGMIGPNADCASYHTSAASARRNEITTFLFLHLSCCRIKSDAEVTEFNEGERGNKSYMYM